MSLAVKFKASVVKNALEMFNHIWGIDNNTLIEEHLNFFGHKATLSDKPWDDSEGVKQQSIDIVFADGSECNIHEYDIEASLTVSESQLINQR